MLRDYSLFEYETVKGRRKYVRISNVQCPKNLAVRFFQTALLAYVMGTANKPRCLRPVKEVSHGTD